MKQKIVLSLLFLFLGGILGYFCARGFYSISGNSTSLGESAMQSPAPLAGSTMQTAEEDEKLDSEQRKADSVGRIDYPLIDIYFEHEKTYKVSVMKYMSDEVVKEYEDTGDFFQFNKEYISILTCPSGRGTTPPFHFCIYEGDNLIKDMECFMVREGVLDDKW